MVNRLLKEYEIMGSEIRGTAKRQANYLVGTTLN